MVITSNEIKEIFSIYPSKEFTGAIVAPLDFENDRPIITYLADRKYIQKLNKKKNVVAVFITSELVSLVNPELSTLICDDPKWYFYSLIDHLGRHKLHVSNSIDPSASIHKTTFIAETGVTIGRDVIIEPNVVIMEGVTIGNNCRIRAGAVIGCDGFEQKRTSKGILSVTHDGLVKIEDSVEIGPNNNIAKGFSYRNTIIGEFSKFDALVHFAHSAQCGSRCFIAANAVISGSVAMGNDVWVGPSATISSLVKIGDRANITLGAVVIRDVAPNEHVSGNFAVPHSKFIKHVLSIIR